MKKLFQGAHVRAFSLAGVLIAITAASIAAAGPAFAESAAEIANENVVTIPYGDALAQLLNVAAAGAVTLVAALFSKIPFSLADRLRQANVDQILTRAITYGINATENAVKGRTLDVNTGNAVAAMAGRYVMKYAPDLFVKRGAQVIEEMIFARIDLEAESAIPAPAAGVVK